jgi:divalent metal cation (Fe/Co/Zn/Cd) transporter
MAETPRAGSVGRNWVRIGLWLVAATLAYNVLEAVVALWAGVQARSVALVGFGLDSVIECAAAVFLLWRLSKEARGTDPETIEHAERQVRHFVGLTFMGLAVYVLLEAAWTLFRHEAPEVSGIGIALAAVSLVVMPLIAFGKLRAAREIKSSALRAEAMETLACAYLSFALLLGLIANAAAGLWWADPIAALLMVPWLVKEGIEGLRGEESCGGSGGDSCSDAGSGSCGGSVGDSCGDAGEKSPGGSGGKSSGDPGRDPRGDRKENSP